ncbi:MAG: leucyl aminopeptidase family protein [Candidatus Obscuribacterales bacterium]|nr:leucyl aminopeptidase family protein [Steroidobacteraceae bacterium]
MLEALTAATLAAAAPMPQFKSKTTSRPALREITILHAGSRPNFDASLATHAGNHLARWLTTLPPNKLTCVSYARALRALATRMQWRSQFIGEAQLKRLGAGAFLAVSRANSHRGAGIAKLSYRPKVKSRGSIALVGKGICFDTGGINLKSHKSMYQMHEDMQGSAVAVGTLLALSELKAPFDIDCWVALTENEIAPQAYRPQEVVTAVNGVTIQVAHSDAEGRMVLADTLALAARSKPHVILDFATLTGACIGALTERMSGVFSNRDAWRASLEQAGRDSGERVWAFPMDEDYDSDLDSPIADLLQCTPDSKGDHILAARFLNRFVPADIGWVHVDLAASNRRGGLAHIPTDITGFGVRFAVEWLMNGAAAGAWGMSKNQYKTTK